MSPKKAREDSPPRGAASSNRNYRRRMLFLVVAFFFHLVYAYSIFDIYFVSPIVTGMKGFAVERDDAAPARRLVLYVADGLRADKTFQSFPDPSPDEGDADPARPRRLAPFVRSLVLEHGTFGVSHTRVPTESRPGHVALIAGLYEDVSAVTTGWKHNPVNFDSVFNCSRHTWSWGSPDILPMFQEGAVPGRVDADSYEAEAEDFTTSDSTHLDTWVFDKVLKMFNEDASSDPVLNAALRQDKIVFFLHLLGLDTSGHAYRPYSKEYLHNIKVVDEGVRKITETIEEFYGDNKTAFIFTADHGMSDWGSHGDGHPDNTRTPLVVWGSGVAKPISTQSGLEDEKIAVAKGHEDGFSSDWGLDHIQRNDVNQADVAALMSYLIGVNFPANSVGELPLPFLDATGKEKAEALLVNAQQILEMYKVKEEDKRAVKLHFSPFPPFARAESTPSFQIGQIKELIEKGQHKDAVEATEKLMNQSLEGLRYLQTYDWLFLRTLGTLAYVGWIVYAMLTVIDIHVVSKLPGSAASAPEKPETAVPIDQILLTLVGSVLSYYLAAEQAPLRYYFYAMFPTFFWYQNMKMFNVARVGIRELTKHVSATQAIVGALLSVGFMEALVYSYFERRIYTVIYTLGAFWPLFQFSRDTLAKKPVSYIRWATSCLMMGGFTLLPALKVESNTINFTGGFCMLFMGLAYLHGELNEPVRSKLEVARRCIIGAQVGLIPLAMLTTWSSTSAIQARLGLPLGAQVVGWVTLVSSVLVLPLAKGAVNKRIKSWSDTVPEEKQAATAAAPKSQTSQTWTRMMSLFVVFSPTFIILTISYEGLFFCSLFLVLFSWFEIEAGAVPTESQEADAATDGASRSLSLNDARAALFFLFFIQSGFFSTGNLASVSSFSLDAVNRLVPVFDPFSQGALLMFKLLAPYALISGAGWIVNADALRLSDSAIFMTAIALADVLALHFFFLVKDEGSWLDIGTTISNFLIAQLLGLFVVILEGVGSLVV